MPHWGHPHHFRLRIERVALVAFREALTVLANQLSRTVPPAVAALPAGEAHAAQQGQGPLVIIIDELDRCRPLFALSLLERVKHLFLVEGVSFVFVTNMPQIEAVVAGTYGANTDAKIYLEKFF